MALTPRLWLALGCFAMAALLVGFVVGLSRPNRAMIETGVAGGGAALILLVNRLSFEAGEAFNPLVFGWPGMLLAVGLATLGGWLGTRLRDRVRVAASPSVLFALQAMGLWVALEWTARTTGATLLGVWLHSALIGDFFALLVAFPLIAWAVVRFGEHRGIGHEDWGYRWGARELVAGVIGGLAILLLLPATAMVDRAVFGLSGAAVEPLLTAVRQSAWIAGIFLVANGIVVPIAEEMAWRGVIQTALARTLGHVQAIWFGGMAFAFKHVLIDASAERLTTLIMFGLCVSFIRARWGTGSSTLAHLLANLAATTLALIR